MASPLRLFPRLPGRSFTQLLALLTTLLLSACGSDAEKVTSEDASVNIAGDTTGDTLVAVQDTNIVCVDTAPLGDGWGWNGSAPCRITGDDVPAANNPGSVPDSADLECVDTAPLGDGWGWNGWSACQITDQETNDDDNIPSVSLQAQQVADTVVIDTPIADDNNTGPQTSIAVTDQSEPLGVGDITDLILVTGQSNALGADAGADASLDAPDDRVFAFTDQGWQVANLDQVWDLGRYPRNSINTIPSNNFGLHFGKRVVERMDERVVGFILVTAPGEAISHWDDSGQFFGQIRDKVSRAISDLPNKSKVDGILWHQGESDGADDDDYGVALYTLIGNFRSEPWFEFGFPFICGETAAFPVNQQLQKLNQDNDEWTACIEAEGLPTFEDGAHFTAEALRIMGRRYADQYIEMFLGG